MTLAEYLKRKNLKPTAFARLHDLDVSTVHRALHGKVMPSVATMRAIYDATNGAVTAGDLAKTREEAAA